MQDLAIIVVTILMVIYSSSLIAFGLSWSRNKVVRIFTFIFSGFAIASGVWFAVTLPSTNGILIGSMPIILGAFSAWNTVRRSRG